MAQPWVWPLKVVPLNQVDYGHPAPALSIQAAEQQAPAMTWLCQARVRRCCTAVALSRVNVTLARTLPSRAARSLAEIDDQDDPRSEDP